MATSDEAVGGTGQVFLWYVRIALKLKGVAYQFLEEVIGSKGELIKSELLLNLIRVCKKIPVLVHGGKPICFCETKWHRLGSERCRLDLVL